MAEDEIDYAARLPIAARAGHRARAAARRTSSSTPTPRDAAMADPRRARAPDRRHDRHPDRQPRRCRYRSVDPGAGRRAPRLDPSTDAHRGVGEERTADRPDDPVVRCVAGQFLVDVGHPRARHPWRAATRPARARATRWRSGSPGSATASRELRDGGRSRRAPGRDRGRAYTSSAPARSTATCATTRFEFLRASTGRRSVEQIAAWAWDGDDRGPSCSSCRSSCPAPTRSSSSAVARRSGPGRAPRRARGSVQSRGSPRRRAAPSPRRGPRRRPAPGTRRASAMCGIQPPASPNLPDAWIPLASSSAIAVVRLHARCRSSPTSTIFPSGRGSRAIAPG